MPADLTPDLALFVGGMIAFVCLFAAAVTFVAAPPGSFAIGLAWGLAALGVGFLALGALVAGVVWLARQ